MLITVAHCRPPPQSPADLESLEGDDQDAVYDLVANVFHTGGVDDGMYRVHVRNVQNDQVRLSPGVITCVDPPLPAQR